MTVRENQLSSTIMRRLTRALGPDDPRWPKAKMLVTVPPVFKFMYPLFVPPHYTPLHSLDLNVNCLWVTIDMAVTIRRWMNILSVSKFHPLKSLCRKPHPHLIHKSSWHFHQQISYFAGKLFELLLSQHQHYLCRSFGRWHGRWHVHNNSKFDKALVPNTKVSGSKSYSAIDLKCLTGSNFQRRVKFLKKLTLFPSALDKQHR